MITVKRRIETLCLYQYKLLFTLGMYQRLGFYQHMSKLSVCRLVASRVHWVKGRDILDIEILLTFY